MKLEFFIALRYLLRRRKAGFISLISLISVLGVAVGVMALIVVLSVMGGFDRELKSKIVGVNPHVVISKQDGVENYEELMHTLLSYGLPKTHSIAPYITGQGIIRSEQNAVGVMVKGIDPTREDVSFISQALQEGVFFDQAAAVQSDDDDAVIGNIIIGETLARSLYIFEGSTIEVISPYLEKKGLFKSARSATFRVCGIFRFGMHDVDSSLVLMSIENAQYLYNLDTRVTGLSIKLTDAYWAERIKHMIRERLSYPYWVQTWIDMNHNFFQALRVEKNVMAILLFLIILVAAFNIVSTLIMVVMEKTKDIGVLKSIGVTKAALKRIFVLEAAIVGLIGTVLGVGSGLVLVTWLNPIADFIAQTTGFEVFPSDIYYFDKIPTETSLLEVAIIGVGAFVLTVLAGMYPAQRAASLNPAEALRYE